MTTDQREDLAERLDELEAKLDRTLDLVARVAEDLDLVAGLREAVDAGFAEARVDAQRGFADLRNAMRHVGVRIAEAERHRR